MLNFTPPYTQVELKKKEIKSFTGIKVLALLLIFYQHSGMPILPFGLGSRMCELLFVLSGFLVGYNKIEKEIKCSFKSCFDYFISKMILFYPLHVIITFIRCILEYKSFIYPATYLKLLLSLMLLTSWSPHEETFFCFNGSSWFLSALLFCYLLSPLFLRLIKIKKYYILFICVGIIRILLDYIPEYSNVAFLELHTHVNPFVRSLEFFMGMLLVPMYKKTNEKLHEISINKKVIIIISLVETIMIFLTFFFMYKYLEIWLKSLYVLWFCLFCLIFSFDIGIISRFFGLKIFKLFNKIQFEFYLSHTTFFALCNVILFHLHISSTGIYFKAVCVFIEFFVLSLICFIYKNYFREYFCSVMKKITCKLYNFLEISYS